MMPQIEVRTPGARQTPGFDFGSSGSRQGDPGSGGAGGGKRKPATKKAAKKKPAKKK